jgi:hypothetical protein
LVWRLFLRLPSFPDHIGVGPSCGLRAENFRSAPLTSSAFVLMVYAHTCLRMGRYFRHQKALGDYRRAMALLVIPQFPVFEGNLRSSRYGSAIRARAVPVATFGRLPIFNSAMITDVFRETI